MHGHHGRDMTSWHRVSLCQCLWLLWVNTSGHTYWEAANVGAYPLTCLCIVVF